MIDKIFLLVFPLILIAIALAFDSLVFAFFGGLSAVFVGLSHLDTLWIGMIYLGLGMYFMLTAVFAEWEE